MTGEEVIRLEMINKDVLRAGESVGHIELGLDFLKDQLMHDIWVELKGRSGEVLSGKLHLMVQWIHSNKTFYADFLARIQEKINSEQSEKLRLETLLENLREPHGLLKYLDIKTLSSLPREEEMRPAASVLVASMVMPSVQTAYTEPAWELFTGKNMYWSLLVIMGIICNAFRDDLLNQCIGIVGLCCELLLPKKESIGKIKVLIICLGFATIHDFIWLFVAGYVCLLYTIYYRTLYFPYLFRSSYGLSCLPLKLH